MDCGIGIQTLDRRMEVADEVTMINVVAVDVSYL